jgi:hypothetical protein
MSEFFMNLGFSWTLSKLLPYILFFILGIALFFYFKSKFKTRLKKGLFSIVIILPVAIYFVFSPIYEGDFSNNYRELSNYSEIGFKKNEMTVLAIPNCPFCAESIVRLNKLAERTEADRINFVVITDDQEMLELYREKASKKIIVSNVPDFDRFQNVTLGRFPTFVFVDSPNMHIWSNDGFGARAMDWVENEIIKG